MSSRNKKRDVVKEDLPRERTRRIMSIAEAIQELGNEVFTAVPAPLSEELAVAIRELEGPKAELETEMLKKLEEALPTELRKKITNTRTYALGGGSFLFPSVKTTCTINKNEIAVGEYAIVSVLVDGDEVYQPSQPVPTAVLLTLDESGSMNSNQNYKKSRNAALAVINSLRSVDEVGLVTFSDNAIVRSPLTTNHQSVKVILQGLGSPGGLTNLEDAFNTSNNIMAKSTTSYNRMVILFTDGQPSPNPVTQEQNILNSIGTATSNLIHYYTVGYGSSIPLSLLQIIATKTGGKCYPVSNIDDLENLFKDAFDDVKDTLFARDVCITQIVNPEFKVKPNSLNYATIGEEPPGFESAIKSAEANFYNTGKITFPALPLLRKNRHFSFFFEVTAKNCSSKDQTLQVTSPQSSVKYTAGAGTTFSTLIKPVSVKVKACGVYWNKTFDDANSRVIIEINNTYSDREVKNVRVAEVTVEDVRPILSTAKPFGWPQVWLYWPSQAKDINEVYGVEWNLPSSIPANTLQTFSVEVELRPGVDDKKYGFDNPIKINQEEVPPKVGIEHEILNEPKEGGVIEYQVNDDMGVKKKFVIKLPSLNVNSLKQKYPSNNP